MYFELPYISLYNSDLNFQSTFSNFLVFKTYNAPPPSSLLIFFFFNRQKTYKVQTANCQNTPLIEEILLLLEEISDF